jgi:hypothetical protein
MIGNIGCELTVNFYFFAELGKMLKILNFLLLSWAVVACNQQGGHHDIAADTAEARNKPEDTCNYLDMDVSIAGINIYDSESFIAIAGENNKFCEGETYCFSSKNGHEELRLTIHPGTSANVISEFDVRSTRVSGSKYRRLPVDSFITGKGVCIGMRRADLVKTFGNCYTSEQRYNETIRYRIERPRDIKDSLLKRLNMPVYYAEYLIKEGYVAAFKFGLEYP